MTISEYKKKEQDKKAITLPTKKISNNFIENTIVHSNASALKTLFYIATQCERLELEKYKNEDLMTIRLSKKKMQDYTGIDMKIIRRNLIAMQKTSINFIEDDGTFRNDDGWNLLPRFTLKSAKDTFEIKIFIRIAKLIIDVKTDYTFIDTKEIMNLKNKHSIRLLSLLSKINKYSDNVAKRKKMDLDMLNEFFGTRYKTWSELKRRVIDPAKEELDLYSKLRFIYESNFEIIGKGRPSFKDLTIDLITAEPTLLNMNY